MGAPWGDIANQAAFKVHGAETAAVSGIANAFDPVQKAEKRALKRDIKDLETGNLGYSQAKMNQIQADALSQVQGQSEAMTDALNRQRAAGGGSGGAYFAAAQKIAQGAQDTSSRSRGAAVAASDQLGAQRAREIRARITAKAQENRAANAQLGEQLSGNDAAQKGHGFTGGTGGGGGGGGEEKKKKPDTSSIPSGF